MDETLAATKGWEGLSGPQNDLARIPGVSGKEVYEYQGAWPGALHYTGLDGL